MRATRGGLAFPKNASAELREMLLKEMEEPPGGQAAPREPQAEDSDSQGETLLAGSESAEDAAESKASDRPSNKAIKQQSNVALQQQSDEATLQQSVKATKQRLARTVGKTASVEAAPPDIEAMRKTPPFQLNARIPAAFNDWLEEQAFLRRREGVTKTSLLQDALALLIVQSSAGGGDGRGGEG